MPASPHHLEIGLRVDEHAHAGAKEVLVIDESDTDNTHSLTASRLRGIVEVTIHRPSSTPAEKVPPTKTAHSRETVTGRAFIVPVARITGRIRNDESKRIRFPRENKSYLAHGVAMTKGVRERLLDHATDRMLMHGGERSILADRLLAHHETCTSQLIDKRVEIDQHRLGSLSLAVMQLPQEDSHVAERLLRRRGDGGERELDGLRIGLAGAARTVGLRNHHCERVRHHVEHVPSDAIALLLDDDLLFGHDLSLSALPGLPHGSREKTEGPGEAEDCEATEQEQHAARKRR